MSEDYKNELAKQRESSWATGDRKALLEDVRRLAGVRKLADLPKPRVETLDTIARTGYKIEKLVIRPEEGIALPALLFLPEKRESNRVVLYLHDKGKATEAGVGGPIEKLVLVGDAVLAVDLRGNGQTQSTTGGLYGPDFQDAQIAYMMGRSVVGMRAEDVLICAKSHSIGHRATRTAPSIWSPSATSAFPPSMPPPWSPICSIASSSAACWSPGRTSFITA